LSGVAIASGSLDRQTKALAASVRKGGARCRFSQAAHEGEANGEWIIVE